MTECQFKQDQQSYLLSSGYKIF